MFTYDMLVKRCKEKKSDIFYPDLFFSSKIANCSDAAEEDIKYLRDLHAIFSRIYKAILNSGEFPYTDDIYIENFNSQIEYIFKNDIDLIKENALLKVYINWGYRADGCLRHRRKLIKMHAIPKII